LPAVRGPVAFVPGAPTAGLEIGPAINELLALQFPREPVSGFLGIAPICVYLRVFTVKSNRTEGSQSKKFNKFLLSGLFFDLLLILLPLL
jgi:hypothetical protein